MATWRKPRAAMASTAPRWRRQPDHTRCSAAALQGPCCRCSSASIPQGALLAKPSRIAFASAWALLNLTPTTPWPCASATQSSAVPLHDPASACRRAGIAPHRRTGGAQAQDPVARWHRACGDEPAGFMQRLAAVLPRLRRLHLIRFHGVLASSERRAAVVGGAFRGQPGMRRRQTLPQPWHCAKSRPPKSCRDASAGGGCSSACSNRHAASPNSGGGRVKIVAAILERPATQEILDHLELDPQPPPMGSRGRAREPGPRIAA